MIYFLCNALSCFILLDSILFGIVAADVYYFDFVHYRETGKWRMKYEGNKIIKSLGEVL